MSGCLQYNKRVVGKVALDIGFRPRAASIYFGLHMSLCIKGLARSLIGPGLTPGAQAAAIFRPLLGVRYGNRLWWKPAPFSRSEQPA